MTHILPGMLVPHPVINRDNRKSADSLRSVDLVIDGMHCAGCVGRVERALNEIPGVIRANVNLATETAHVQALSNLPLSELQAAILLAGYQSAAMQAGRDAVELRKIEEIRVLRRDVVTALLLTLPVFFLAMGVDLIPAVSQVIDQTMGPLSNRYIQWGLSNHCSFGSRQAIFCAWTARVMAFVTRYERAGCAWHGCCLGLFNRGHVSSGNFAVGHRLCLF